MPILLTLLQANNKSGPKTPGPQTHWVAGSGKHLEKMGKLWDVVASTQSPPSVHPGKPPRGLHAASHRRRLRLTDRLTGVHWRTGLPVKPSLLRNWCFVFVDCCWATSFCPVLPPSSPLLSSLSSLPFYSSLSSSPCSCCSLTSRPFVACNRRYLHRQLLD